MYRWVTPVASIMNENIKRRMDNEFVSFGFISFEFSKTFTFHGLGDDNDSPRYR